VDFIILGKQTVLIRLILVSKYIDFYQIPDMGVIQLKNNVTMKHLCGLDFTAQSIRINTL